MPRAAPHLYDAAMRQAIDVARRADQSEDVPVGAVVLDPAGALLGSGHNAREALGDPTAHAEVMALRQAAASLGRWRLEGCTLVVTLEPCTMCAAAMSFARIRRLYFAAADEKGGAVEHGVRFFAAPTCHHRPDVYGGINESDAAALLKDFFRERR